MKNQIEMMPCKCGQDKMFEADGVRGVLFGHMIGCCNVDCDIHAVVGVGFTQAGAKRKAVKAWNKMVKR